LTEEDVCLISNDWDEEWKLPAEEMSTLMRKRNETMKMKNQMRHR
jgi:hypothetical protein